MSLKTIILKKLEVASIWPSKDNAYLCEVLYSDNSKRKIEIPKAECDLMFNLQVHLKGKLSEREMSKLIDLIEDYGQQKYEEGSFSNNDNEDI